jgi:oligoendopeptidase F
MLERKWRAEVEVFRPANVPLDTELTKLNNDYDKITGDQMVAFRGREYTPQQISRFYEDPDRPTREEAWRAATDRRLADADRLEAIFDKQLPLRQKVAENTGLRTYRDYVWTSYKRFDYTPADCQRFADAIATIVVPVVARLHAERATQLGVEALRPWDLEVDPPEPSPAAPFADSDVDGFVAKTRMIFERMAPDLAADFDELKFHGNLDLSSRKGKQPGGYQCSLEESRQPFIFMNAAGLHRDVETLLHEAGHAFHYQWACRREPLVFVRSAPMEFCEVASMAMELLGGEHLDVFYSPADQGPGGPEEARRHPAVFALDGDRRPVPALDLHAPRHTRDERTAHWLMLNDRFGKGVDWVGLDAAKRTLWQRQLHLFHAPFYYIEYGIAQLGALQLWMKAKEDPRRALANYRAGLSLGGTRSLPGPVRGRRHRVRLLRADAAAARGCDRGGAGRVAAVAAVREQRRTDADRRPARRRPAPGPPPAGRPDPPVAPELDGRRVRRPARRHAPRRRRAGVPPRAVGGLPEPRPRRAVRRGGRGGRHHPVGSSGAAGREAAGRPHPRARLAVRARDPVRPRAGRPADAHARRRRGIEDRDLAADGNDVECPPTAVPRQEALLLAVLMNVPLIRVSEQEDDDGSGGEPGGRAPTDLAAARWTAEE